MKNLIRESVKKTLCGLCIAAALSTPATADEPEKSQKEITATITQKNEYRMESGHTSIKGLVTEGTVEITKGPLYAYCWTAYNNNTGKSNEIDFGVGYSREGERTYMTVEAGSWNYLEEGGHDFALKGTIGLKGLPINLETSITQLLGKEGTLVTGKISKPFDVKIAGINMEVNPFLQSAIMKNYFGATGHNNDIVGCSLSGELGPRTSIELSIKQHYGHGPFNNSTEVGVSFSWSGNKR